MGHFHLETRKPPVAKKRRLIIAISITILIMGVEIVGGILSNSIALLSDAGHMFTHAFALGVSLFALIVSGRPPDLQKTFGYFRIEVLVALLNGVFLVGMTCFIFYESAQRLISPEQVDAREMFLIALLGLVANGASFFLLTGISKHDINLKSAFIHVVYDTASSVVVMISALLIGLTDFLRLDPLVSFGIGVLILLWCINLIRDSVNILLESTPKDVDIASLRRDIRCIRMVQDIHDVHVWQITSDMYIMTAHLVVDDMPVSRTEGVLAQVNQVLSRLYRIGHSTIQVGVSDKSVDISSPREREPG
jgi:cobalt-zinc-cadmium efflux system protein